MRRWQLLAIWLVTVVAATAVTWQIVSLADDRVGESDAAPIQLTTPDSTTTTSPSGSTTVPGSSTSSISTPVPTTSTSVVTTTTPPPATPEVRTIPTLGGTLTVGVVPGAITFLSAVPAPGFALELDEPGPPEVRVEFIGSDTEVEVRVRWKDGQVEIETDVDREN